MREIKMKKVLIFPVLALVFCGGIWSADFSLSTGAGGLVGGFFTRYEAENPSDGVKTTQEVNQFNYGGLVFFDATYGELAITLQNGRNNYSQVMVRNGVLAPDAGEGWETMLGFSLLGKYPFTPAERITLFPLLGVEYQVALSERRRRDGEGGVIYDRTDGFEADKDNEAYDLSAWNSFWINLGVGTDVLIVNDFFVRGELLYGFRLMTAYEKDAMEGAKQFLGDDPDKGGLTSGPSLRLCVGYRFWNL
jgi:hypothetical protein